MKEKYIKIISVTIAFIALVALTVYLIFYLFFNSFGVSLLGGDDVKKIISICTAEKCVWRTQTHNNRAYCFFGKCPYGKAINYSTPKEHLLENEEERSKE